MILSAATSLWNDCPASTPVRHAVENLARDMAGIFGVAPRRAETKEPNQVRVRLGQDGPPETFRMETRDESLTILGADELGTVFGVYHLCRTILGIDPYRFWTDAPAPRATAVDVPAETYVSAEPAVRFRGWFINGEDCLIGWHDDMKISRSTWDIVFDTLLRAGFNMIIPGTGTDADSPQVQWAAERGLWITQHHAEPLGAPMLQAVYPGIRPRYPEDWDKFEPLYRQAIAANRGRNMVWALGFRGQGDHAFYSEDRRHDTPEKQGRVIGEVIRLQRRMVEELHDGKSHFMHNLYSESAALYRAGHLTLDDDIIRVWGDNGFGAMRVRRRGIGYGEEHLSSLPPGEDRDKPSGVYYHVNFHDLEISNQVVPLVAPNVIADQFRALHDAGRIEYLTLNVGNIRPHVIDIDLVGRIVGRPRGAAIPEDLGETHIRAFCRRNYPAVADEAADLWSRYFAAPFSFGPYSDQKAGEQVYHHTLRTGIRAVLDGTSTWPHTGFASELPEDRDERVQALLLLAEASLPEWETLRRDAETLAAESASECRYFSDSLVTWIRYMALSCHGYVHGLNGLLAFEKKQFKQAFLEVSQSKWAMQNAWDTLLTTEHGKWKHFYRGEWLTGTRETVRFLALLQGLCRLRGEPGWKSKWLHEALGLQRIPMNVIAQAHADPDKLAQALLKTHTTPPRNDFEALR